MIAAEPLAYTEHPALVERKKAQFPAVAAAAGAGAQVPGLAIAAGAALAVVGAAAALDTQQTRALTEASAAPSHSSVFEARPASELRPVVPEAVAAAPEGSHTVPLSARLSALASDPRYVAGSAAGSGQAAALAASGAASGASHWRAGAQSNPAGLSSPAPLLGTDVASADPGAVADPAMGAAAGGNMQFRALTSFDGTMTMTAGGPRPVQGAAGAMGCGGSCGQAPQAAALPEPAPAHQPVVWNRPLEWTRVNSLGGANLAGADPRVPN